MSGVPKNDPTLRLGHRPVNGYEMDGPAGPVASQRVGKFVFPGQRANDPLPGGAHSEAGRDSMQPRQHRMTKEPRWCKEDRHLTLEPFEWVPPMCLASTDTISTCRSANESRDQSSASPRAKAARRSARAPMGTRSRTAHATTSR